MDEDWMSDDEDCEHVWLNGVCQRCNSLEPLPGDDPEHFGEQATFKPTVIAAAISEQAWRAHFIVGGQGGPIAPALRAAVGATLRHLAGMQDRWTHQELTALAVEFETWSEQR